MREVIARKNRIEIKYLKKSKNHPADGAGYSQLLKDITVAKMQAHIKIWDLNTERVFSGLINDNSNLNCRVPATFL